MSTIPAKAYNRKNTNELRNFVDERKGREDANEHDNVRYSREGGPFFTSSTSTALCALAFIILLAIGVASIVLSVQNANAIKNDSCTGLCVDGKNGSIGENGTCPASCFNGTDANVTITLINTSNSTNVTSVITNVTQFAVTINITENSTFISTPGPPGTPGTPGTPGPPGTNGTCTAPCVNGTNGTNAEFLVSWTARVDTVFGNDTTGKIATTVLDVQMPYKTIGAAMTAAGALATANTPVLISLTAGVYNEAVVFQPWIGLRSPSLQTTIIRMLSVTGDTDLVTMAENTRLEDVTLLLTSSGHHALRGIVLPGTTSATSKVRTTVLTVDNSGASTLGSSNVYGVHSIGTGQPDEDLQTIRATTIKVLSVGGGAKRALLVDAANVVRSRDSNFISKSVNLTGTSIGAETNASTATVYFHAVTLAGDTADLSKTQGFAYVGYTDLTNANANGKTFSTRTTPSKMMGKIGSWDKFDSFGVGQLVFLWINGINFNVEATAQYPIVNKAVVFNLIVQVGVPLPGNNTCFIVVRKNGADTVLSTTLTGPSALSAMNVVDSVSFGAGDLISLRTNCSITATADGSFVLDMY